MPPRPIAIQYIVPVISIDSLFLVVFDTPLPLQILSVDEVELEPTDVARTTLPLDALTLSPGSMRGPQVVPSLRGRGRSGPGTQGPRHERERPLLHK